jgi:hypothetical protein
MNKKGVSMPLNVVIIAIILLVVLGVVLWIFLKGVAGPKAFVENNGAGIEKCAGKTDCDFVDDLLGTGDDADVSAPDTTLRAFTGVSLPNI